LQRFYRDEQKRRHLEHLAELAAQTNALDNPAIEAESAELTRLMAAARAEFVHATFELAKAADGPKNYEMLERAFHHRDLVRLKTEELKLKQQELALARERLAETKRQFNYNAGRAALIHNIELQKIMKNRKLDNEDKIWAACDVCFGPGSSGQPPAQFVPTTIPKTPAPDQTPPSSFPSCPSVNQSDVPSASTASSAFQTPDSGIPAPESRAAA
jgi:hypothetical protein